ncbi:hypothetical protein QNI16_00850 [Cytophagaceae bacterium YF14B1]|uniref:Lipoprotein n=1 Tax=Xanthocytophaga flava TaxID=3048013 RepID=A0AAE3QGM0_9BACT|nr:hypothetical protein [Xanthocytophaga flavus]MDJ1479007.1 hypothetical protein [Xanthocytophaga flavus]
MKKSCSLLLAYTAILTFFASCGSQEIVKPESNTKHVSSSAKVLPSDAYWITQNPDGEYVSSYGGGIKFGKSLIRPTVVDQTGNTDGEPISGFSNGLVTFQNFPTLSSMVNNEKFVAIEPTFPNAITIDEIIKYFGDLKAYWSDQSGIVERPKPIGSTTGSGSVYEVRGMVVRDHTSPTNASVVPDTYVYTPGTTTPPTGGLYICFMTLNGYALQFYGSNYTSGKISKILVTNSSTVTVSSFSIRYKSVIDGYELTGTATLSNGTTLTFTNTLANPST